MTHKTRNALLTIAMGVGLWAVGMLVRSMGPELVRYLRIKRM